MSSPASSTHTCTSSRRSCYRTNSLVSYFLSARLQSSSTRTELANVLGTDGVHWLLDACEGLPLDFYFMASSTIPASEFESPRRPLLSGDLESLLRRRRVLGLAEMMNFPGVIKGDAGELDKLRLANGVQVDGHAPGLLGKALNAYVAAGIRSDHEALTLEEGRERLRRGMWLLIREASMARSLQALLPLVKEFGTNRIAFCTDDRDPEDIAENGHINGMVREAVAAGIAPEDAVVLATINPATWHRLWHLGAIAPGYQADLLLLPDLERFEPELTLKAGRPVEEIPEPDVPEWVKHSVRNKPVSAADFQIPWDTGKARAIGLVPDQVVTESVEVEPTTVGGFAVADAGNDLAKIAVIERHLGTGRIGHGFVRGSGLQRGALASTVAHDAHNIVVVGMDDDDMTRAVERLGELGGGIVVVDGGEVEGRAAASRRRTACRRTARNGDREEPGVQRRRARGRLVGCDAFPDAVVPGLVGDPEPEDHRPRPRRRRPLPDRAAEALSTLLFNAHVVTMNRRRHRARKRLDPR